MSLHNQLPEMNPDDEYCFVARTTNFWPIYSSLKVIAFREYATFCCTDKWIKITVDENHYLQGNAFIEVQAFHEYHLRPHLAGDDDENQQAIWFKANIRHIVTCMKVKKKHPSSMKLSYRGLGHPFELLIEENNMVRDCRLKTYEVIPPGDFDIDIDHNRFTMPSDTMRLLMREIDPTSDLISLSVSPNSPNFRVSTKGCGGSCVLELEYSDNVFRTFTCPHTFDFLYRFVFLKMAIKPLTIFESICVRMDKMGLLRLQYMTNTPAMRHYCAEFYCSASVDS